MAKQSKKRPPLRQKSLPRINTRQRTAKKKKPGPQKEFQGDPILRARSDKIKRDVVDEIEKLPINDSTGKPFRGSIMKVIKFHQKFNPWLSEEMIRGLLKRKTKAKAKEKKDKTILDNILQRKPPPKYSVLQQSTEETFRNLKPAPKPAGRPKGTTNAATEERDRKFAEMKNAITIGWADTNTRPSCTMREWIDDNRKEYGFDTDKPEDQVSRECIFSRIQRKRLECGGTGQISPLAVIEPRIVMFIKFSSDCNQTMTKQEIVDSVNAYIEGSELEKDYVR